MARLVLSISQWFLPMGASHFTRALVNVFQATISFWVLLALCNIFFINGSYEQETMIHLNGLFKKFANVITRTHISNFFYSRADCRYAFFKTFTKIVIVLPSFSCKVAITARIIVY